MQHNDMELKRNIKIRNSESTPTLENERVPTKPELNQIFTYADERAKVMIAFVAQAGLRLETIGNYTGTDGLRIQDLPEMIVIKTPSAKTGNADLLPSESSDHIETSYRRIHHNSNMKHVRFTYPTYILPLIDIKLVQKEKTYTTIL
jgi:hypothetical protein